MYQVTIHFSDEVAAALSRARSPRSAPSELQSILDDFGLELEPLHRGSRDAELRKQYYIIVPDGRTGEEVSAKLRNVNGVEAAYVKSPGAPPG